jgi:hypothetical protein
VVLPPELDEACNVADSADTAYFNASATWGVLFAVACGSPSNVAMIMFEPTLAIDLCLGDGTP